MKYGRDTLVALLQLSFIGTKDVKTADEKSNYNPQGSLRARAKYHASSGASMPRDASRQA